MFVKVSERANMRDIAITTVKTGMKGRYGNKVSDQYLCKTEKVAMTMRGNFTIDARVSSFESIREQS